MPSYDQPLNIGRDDGSRGDRMLVGRLNAAIVLIGRTGARGFEIAFDDDTPGRVDWTAQALWTGRKIFSERFPYPAQAAEDLLSKVVNGGQCARCKLRTVVGLYTDGYCTINLVATDLDDVASYHYVKSCDIESAIRDAAR